MHCLTTVVFLICIQHFDSTLKLKVCSAGGGVSKLTPKIQPLVKLPVWPAWSGIGAQVTDWLDLKAFSQKIVNKIGGRVVPMDLSGQNGGPFLLLVHHMHSFSAVDPMRYFSRLLLPEGFPSHPHSGFDTVTICLEGGLKHRDSAGESMIYGDGDVQWMRAGRGVIHEEMWNLDALKKPAEASGAKEKESSRDHSQNLLGQKIEIFQLWINLPKKNKDDPPMLHLLKAEDIPVLRCSNGGYVRVICGDVAANTGSDNGVTDPNPPVEKLASAKHSLNVAASPVSILQVSVPSNDKLHFMIPASKIGYSTLVYVRRGSLLFVPKETSGKNARKEEEEVHQESLLSYTPPTAHPDDANFSDTRTCELEIRAGRNGLDALVLVGEKLNEPVHWQGPFVQADEDGLRRSAERFGSLPGSAYWEHTLTDANWRKRLQELHLKERLS